MLSLSLLFSRYQERNFFSVSERLRKGVGQWLRRGWYMKAALRWKVVGTTPGIAQANLHHHQCHTWALSTGILSWASPIEYQSRVIRQLLHCKNSICRTPSESSSQHIFSENKLLWVKAHSICYHTYIGDASSGLGCLTSQSKAISLSPNNLLTRLPWISSHLGILEWYLIMLNATESSRSINSSLPHLSLDKDHKTASSSRQNLDLNGSG